MSADDDILCINITSPVDSVERSLEAQSGSWWFMKQFKLYIW